MALITCKECSNKLSDLAETCPHCGAPSSLSKMKNCFECKTPLEDGNDTCSNCGVNQNANPTLEKETPKSNKPEPEIKKEVTPAKPIKKRNVFPLGLKVFGVLILLAIIGFQFLSDHDKKSIYHELGIENSDFVKENVLGSYVEMDFNVSKNLLGNKWVFTGTIWSTHSSAVIRRIKVQFNFSDGSETVILNKKLNPDAAFKDLFEKRIPGHSNARFIDYEVLGAYE